MDGAAWVEDFVAQQVQVVLETARQELEMDEAEFASYLEDLDANTRERHQAIMDEFVAGIMATFDFDGLLDMHERTFTPKFFERMFFIRAERTRQGGAY